jgi:hypothetical protein
MRRQRGSWREHDAALALAWQRRDDVQNLIVLADWQASVTPAP